MARGGRPALLVVIVGCLVLSAPWMDAQSRRRPPVNYIGGHAPDQAEGARILDDMRAIGLGGPYYQDFELRLLPRKGQERRQRGRWFGDRNAEGSITRIELFSDSTNPEILLIQNGPRPRVWRLSGEPGPVEISGVEVLRPLAGTTLSAADLQIPFMYWTDFVYEGREPFRGRPTFVFLLYPPAEEATAFPEIGGARVFIDTQYHVPLQAQWVNEEGAPLKTISVLDLKKIDEQWIVKSFEVRDERTRDKTRFVVMAVAFSVRMPDSLFSPEGPTGAAALEFSPGQLQPVR